MVAAAVVVVRRWCGLLCRYKFQFIAKGGGSANKTYLFQETKALLNPTRLMCVVPAECAKHTAAMFILFPRGLRGLHIPCNQPRHMVSLCRCVSSAH